MFEESLALPHRPPGYDDLCALLVDPRVVRLGSVCDSADRFWLGVEAWADSRGLVIYEEMSHAISRLCS